MGGSITGRVLKLYPELGCVRVATAHPMPRELDYVPVGQKLRGVYGLPEEGSTVVLHPLNGGSLWVVGDIIPEAALRATTLRYKATPPKHLDRLDRPTLPHHTLLRQHVVVIGDTIKTVGGSDVEEVEGDASGL